MTPVEEAQAIADAVLYEGYILYPYRSTSDKNRARFQWGVLCPRGAELDGAGEGPDLRLECLIDPGTGTELEAHVRFLRLQERVPERAEGGGFTPVETLEIDGRRHVRFAEAVEEVVPIGPLGLDGLLTAAHEMPIELDGGIDIEDLGPQGRLVRRRWPLRAVVVLSATPAEPGLIRLRADVRNLVEWGGMAEDRDTPRAAPAAFAGPTPAGEARDLALRRSLIASHLIVEVADGAFVSLTDPPQAHRDAASGCTNLRTWPVLLGVPGSADVVLASPIILEDHPEIAPESPAALFDATEIDEILLLRVLTLTDQEKLEARATDPRAAAIIDLAEDLSPEAFGQLHGAIRSLRAPHGVGVEEPDWPGISGAIEAEWSGISGPEVPMPDAPWWDPGTDASVDPSTDAVLIGGVSVARGSHVRLVPGRRADAHDIFLTGRAATVAAVLHDVDGEVHVAVTIDDDPGADLWDATGRYLYFSPEEIEPLEGAVP